MTGVGLLAGVVLPQSIMHTQWFAVLSMFVAINTVLYLTLAIIKLLPKAYLSDWVDQRNRRTESRSIYPDNEGAGQFDGKVALRTYANAWLGARVRISPRTRQIYDSQLRLHILPALVDGLPGLGDVALDALTPDLVRVWYAALLAERGSSVAAKAYTRLRQILAQAVDDDRIAENPCRIEGAGAERLPERRFATMAELYLLAGAVPERDRVFVLTAGLAGLRQGELAALRRGDVDLIHGAITVRRRPRLASGQIIDDETTSAAGTRRVALPASLVADLERHMAVYAAPGADGLVFTSPMGRAIERSNFRYRVWVPAARSVGVAGLRFHDLRHTAGTLAAPGSVASGASFDVVQNRAAVSNQGFRWVA